MFAEPIPHLVIRRHGLGDPTQDLIYIFRRVRGRGLQLSVYCARDEWAKVKPWVCRAFLDTRVAYPHWPAPVVGRKVQMSGGVGVSIGAGVDPKQIKIIHHCFAAVEKRLSGWHGPPIRSATEPFVVHVNLTRDGHAAMTGAGDRFEISGGVRERRALTVPIGPRGSRTRASLVNEAAATYLGDLYGVQNPYWMHVGERLLAKIADETGKDLPYVTTAFAASVGLLDGTFADLAADRNIRRDRRDDHCIAYVALLRSGPSIYKKAYKAFLAELRQTCNSPAAVARHLLVLDQPRMLEDVRALVKKLRPIEVKAR
jgi:hypothetical protein